MFRFLYLFGPGVLSWFIYSRYSRRDGILPREWKTVVWMPVEITAYAFLNFAVLAAALKPLGRITFSILPDGTLDVHYGATAFLASAVLAAVIGIFSYRAEKHWQKG